MRTFSLLPLLAACTGPVDGSFEEHSVAASGYDQRYALTVFLPDGLPDPARVVYVLDGDDWTDTTAAVVTRLVREGAIDPPLVVGIGYGDRRNQRARDYTPPAKNLPDGFGEVEAFYGFVEDDLIPWVDERYDTDPSPSARTVMGHSFGGVGALWAAFESDDIDNVVALSPSLTLGDGVFFDVEAEREDALVGRVYLGAGGAEAFGLAGLTEAFGDQLSNRDDPELAVQTELFPNRVHSEVFPHGAESGLRFVDNGR